MWAQHAAAVRSLDCSACGRMQAAALRLDGLSESLCTAALTTHDRNTNKQQALTSTRAVCFNGFVFDELPLGLVKAAVEVAAAAGAAIFFDPGAPDFHMLGMLCLHAVQGRSQIYCWRCTVAALRRPAAVHSSACSHGHAALSVSLSPQGRAATR